MIFQLNKKLSALGIQGLETKVFSAFSAGISVREKGSRQRAWFSCGVTRTDNQGCAVAHSTLFDLASLTKPLCTVLCTLSLIEQKKFAWDDVLGEPYPPDKRNIRLRHLLQHSSGFPAYQPYFRQFPAQQHPRNKAKILQYIMKEPLVYPTGSTCVYSDLGFILLGDFLEKRSGVSLDLLFKKQISEPLNLDTQLLFLPVEGKKHRDRKAIAATENCGWRKSILQGQVHDEHSWLMGGVAGHAGVFGTVEAVMRLCELLLDIWKGRARHPAFCSEQLCHALDSKHRQSGWCLGFDTPSPGISSSGRYFSPGSVGHLGFSGTSFWIDPEKEIVVVLLTNRIHPTRDNSKIRRYRPYFHDQLMEIVCR